MSPSDSKPELMTLSADCRRAAHYTLRGGDEPSLRHERNQLSRLGGHAPALGDGRASVAQRSHVEAARFIS